MRGLAIVHLRMSTTWSNRYTRSRRSGSGVVLPALSRPVDVAGGDNPGEGIRVAEADRGIRRGIRVGDAGVVGDVIPGRPETPLPVALGHPVGAEEGGRADGGRAVSKNRPLTTTLVELLLVTLMVSVPVTWKFR